jgi:hypothetical protein
MPFRGAHHGRMMGVCGIVFWNDTGISAQCWTGLTVTGPDYQAASVEWRERIRLLTTEPAAGLSI